MRAWWWGGRVSDEDFAAPFGPRYPLLLLAPALQGANAMLRGIRCYRWRGWARGWSRKDGRWTSEPGAIVTRQLRCNQKIEETVHWPTISRGSASGDITESKIAGILF
jgi:hypothetical protein